MRRRISNLTLTQQVALLSLVPIVALGFALTTVLRGQTDARSLADAGLSARLIARIGIQPRLSPGELAHGLSPQEVSSLDAQLRTRAVARTLARVKVWNSRHVVVYSNDHALIGRSFTPSDDLGDALAGRPHKAQVITPEPGGETASEVGLGRLVEVYVPLRFHAGGRPAGAFELYLSYAPIAAAISSEDRAVSIIVAVGLALLWALLYPMVARAGRRLARQSEERYVLARYDRLTGLPNRTLFIERVAAALADTHDPVAVLLLDIEGFKEINDTLGHSTGDLVLMEVAQRLSAGLSDGSTVARLAGDEYGVVQPATADAAAAAAAIQARLQEPIVVDGVALNVEVSVGVAVSVDHGEDADVLHQHADAALARARARHSGVEVYSPEHDRSSADRLRLLGEVRPALERDEFVLHYQPKVDLAGGHVIGVEALLRWQHPQRGLVPPMDFIPLLEQTALVGPVSVRVIDTALAQLAQWRAVGLDIEMAVNLSARNLLDRTLPERISQLLERHAVPADRLTVEVTESAAMADQAAAVETLKELRGMGIGVSIDDFGTGNASVAYLTTLPATELKIDRSFVTNVCTDARDEAIVRAVIDLAGHFGLKTVAEGIETDDVMRHLARIGCDVGQGFGISRPLPADELTPRLLEDEREPPVVRRLAS